MAAQLPTVADVCAAVDQLYPPHLAESWDAVGLVCGDPGALVSTVLVAVDPTEEVAAEAQRLQADLLLVHHPLLFKAVHSVAAVDPHGRVLNGLIQAGCALLTAHTNADSASPGVSDALAEAVGVTVERALVPRQESDLLLITYVPPSHLDTVIDALRTAGAGRIGDYERCGFSNDGIGTYEVPVTAQPFAGTPGQRSAEPETRLEMVVPRGFDAAVVDALLRSHPYEEVAYSLLTRATIDQHTGLGRVGSLSQPMTLGEFADRVAAAVPHTSTGIRVAGDLAATVRTVGLCGGSGGDFLPLTSGCDVYITSDLRHHVVQDHLAAGGCAIIEVTHWAAERPWCDQAATLLRDLLGTTGYADTRVLVSAAHTDPWTQGSFR